MSNNNTLIRGTMLLTAATFLSKFLGMIYVIPFNALVGATGGALYGFAYTPYNILISISTVGVPLAVSKFVSKYNSLGDYETGIRIYKTGLKLMLATGFLAFLVLFTSSHWLAEHMLTQQNKTGITVDEISMVLKLISFALIIIPAMSLSRGFFQGYQSMGPTAISTVVEQIVRIAFVLIAAFIILKIYKGSVALAVGYATFAAFIGALASCVVLFYYWTKRKPYIEEQRAKQDTIHKLPLRAMFKELLMYAGPFVLVGLATPLYQLVDQFTFSRAMAAIGQSEVFEIYYSAINVYGHKLVLIPVTLATGLSLAIIPAMTKTFTERNQAGLHRQITQALQIIVVLVVPAAAGLATLSKPAYASLYGLANIDLTGSVLAWYAPVALLFALFTVSAAILQGINQQSFAVISLSAGLLMKIIFNIQLIHIFGAKGAIFGTALAVGTAVILNLYRIHKSVGYSYKPVFKITMLVLLFTLIMSEVVIILKWLISFFTVVENGILSAIFILLAEVVVGGLIYLWLGYKSTLLQRVLGDRVNILSRIFGK
ncbi:polysaccharide biosynthesis protein [Aciduricibacillus chroicocephali]|uniref:Polysaccharide biosynthesis protein n=1 Tax=Aciduricibacillus chroicocephali TaxID=3054939 RepID=A0ABY9KST7_9BACI|nr:polysaccharide biosynthesis protein [Bacillaceae bacterium 44XB]